MWRVLMGSLVLQLVLFTTLPAAAQNAQGTNADELLMQLSSQQQYQVRSLWNRLKCVVCSGQSVAQSQAPIAQDIRLRVLEAVRDGQSSEMIEAALAQRYGADILLSPPNEGSGRALWLAPLAFLGFGLLLMLRINRQREP